MTSAESSPVSSEEDGFLEDDQQHLSGMKREYQAPPPDLFVDPFEDSFEYLAKRPKIPVDWEHGDCLYDCSDEWSDNFIIVAPDEGLF